MAKINAIARGRGNKIKRRPMSEINVVPYIDVMLVLLVIFMMTTPLLSQGVKVDLPKKKRKRWHKKIKSRSSSASMRKVNILSIFLPPRLRQWMAQRFNLWSVRL